MSLARIFNYEGILEVEERGKGIELLFLRVNKQTTKGKVRASGGRRPSGERRRRGFRLSSGSQFARHFLVTFNTQIVGFNQVWNLASENNIGEE